MGLMIKEILILFIYTICINLVLTGFANLNSGISCPNVYSYSSSVSLNETEFETGVSSNPITLTNTVITTINLITNQCEGIPYILVLIFELPVLIGFLYIARSFIGAT